jgi:protein-disulfide isomerase
MSAGSRLRPVVDFAAAIAMIVAAGVLVWTAVVPDEPDRPVRPPRAEVVPTRPVPLDGIQFTGNASARLAIIEFADFECPACSRFARETLPGLMDQYVRPGKARFGFRHFPLPNHPNAAAASAAAHCAGEQGRFWEMKHALFASPAPLDDERIKAAAASASLDLVGWSSCLQGLGPREAIQRDVTLGRGLSLNGTPTFLVGVVEDGALRATSRFVGARPLSDFEAALKTAGESGSATADSPGEKPATQEKEQSK